MPVSRLRKAQPMLPRVTVAASQLPRYPRSWNHPSSANPEQPPLPRLNRAREPGIVRLRQPRRSSCVAREVCGLCHLGDRGGERSPMSSARCCGRAGITTGSCLKIYSVGRGPYPRRAARPASVCLRWSSGQGGPPAAHCARRWQDADQAQAARGASALYPPPRWRSDLPRRRVPRVRARRRGNISTQFPEITCPPERLDPAAGGAGAARTQRERATVGRALASRRYPGAEHPQDPAERPFMWFPGTNDQPGDHRSSGCSGCHVVWRQRPRADAAT